MNTCDMESPDLAMAEVSQEILNRLFAVLKKWSNDGMDAFRYEMFSRRLVAAEHGRPDAVEWALKWYADEVGAEIALKRKEEQDRNEEFERKATARAELLAGRSDNPRYQAFLDTIEDPASVTNHVAYMHWINSAAAECASLRQGIGLSETQRIALMDQVIEERRVTRLAPRVVKEGGDRVRVKLANMQSVHLPVVVFHVPNTSIRKPLGRLATEEAYSLFRAQAPFPDELVFERWPVTAVEGDTAGTRLYAHEVKESFISCRLGHTVHVKKGAFKGAEFKVVGKMENRFDKYLFVMPL